MVRTGVGAFVVGLFDEIAGGLLVVSAVGFDEVGLKDGLEEGFDVDVFVGEGRNELFRT